MLIPRVMKGLEKSITFSRSEVMVKPATARSAFYRGKERQSCSQDLTLYVVLTLTSHFKLPFSTNKTKELKRKCWSSSRDLLTSLLSNSALRFIYFSNVSSHFAQLQGFIRRFTQRNTWKHTPSWKTTAVHL